MTRASVRGRSYCFSVGFPRLRSVCSGTYPSSAEHSLYRTTQHYVIVVVGLLVNIGRPAFYFSMALLPSLDGFRVGVDVAICLVTDVHSTPYLDDHHQVTDVPDNLGLTCRRGDIVVFLSSDL